jgi:hypothetical protein
VIPEQLMAHTPASVQVPASPHAVRQVLGDDPSTPASEIPEPSLPESAGAPVSVPASPAEDPSSPPSATVASMAAPLLLPSLPADPPLLPESLLLPSLVASGASPAPDVDDPPQPATTANATPKPSTRKASARMTKPLHDPRRTRGAARSSMLRACPAGACGCDGQDNLH